MGEARRNQTAGMSMLPEMLQAAAVKMLMPVLGLSALMDFGLPDDLARGGLWGGPANDFGCRSTVHPNPVVLLHGAGRQSRLPPQQAGPTT